MSIYETSLDLKKSFPIYNDPIILRQGDTNVKILVHVFDNSTPKNLENLPIEFHADKPDATTIDDDEQSHFAIGADKQSFTYTVPDELTDASGSTTNTYFKIGNDSTSNFYIHIMTKAGMEKLESGDYISKVDRIFNHVMSDYAAINNIAETGEGTFDTALAASKKEMKDLMDNLNAEYVQFINSKTTEFKTFLTNLNAQATDVKNKYDALQAQLDLAAQNISGVRTNLLTGTSSSEQSYTTDFSTRPGWENKTSVGSVISVNAGNTYTYSVYLTKLTGSFIFGYWGYDSNKNYTSWIYSGSYSSEGKASWTFTVPSGISYIFPHVVHISNDFTCMAKEEKLELGSHATDWCPNPAEILTQSDYAKIKAAIVALGGSLS